MLLLFNIIFDTESHYVGCRIVFGHCKLGQLLRKAPKQTRVVVVKIIQLSRLFPLRALILERKKASVRHCFRLLARASLTILRSSMISGDIRCNLPETFYSLPPRLVMFINCHSNVNIYNLLSFLVKKKSNICVFQKCTIRVSERTSVGSCSFCDSPMHLYEFALFIIVSLYFSLQFYFNLYIFAVDSSVF